MFSKESGRIGEYAYFVWYHILRQCIIDEFMGGYRSRTVMQLALRNGVASSRRGSHWRYRDMVDELF